MPRKTVEDLERIRERARQTSIERKVIVHMGTCGIASGAQEILDALLDETSSEGIEDVVVVTSGCAGLCSREPMVTVELRGAPPVKYVDVTPEKIKRILKEHVLGGRVVLEYALAVGSETVA